MLGPRTRPPLSMVTDGMGRVSAQGQLESCLTAASESSGSGGGGAELIAADQLTTGSQRSALNAARAANSRCICTQGGNLNLTAPSL